MMAHVLIPSEARELACVWLERGADEVPRFARDEGRRDEGHSPNR